MKLVFVKLLFRHHEANRMADDQSILRISYVSIRTLIKQGKEIVMVHANDTLCPKTKLPRRYSSLTSMKCSILLIKDFKL